MIGYKLQENYIKNLEALLMKKQSHVASSSATLLIVAEGLGHDWSSGWCGGDWLDC